MNKDFKIKYEKAFSILRKYLIIVFGIAVVAFGISVFYVPNKVVNGGVSGISTILYNAFGVPISISFAVMNGILLLLAFFFLDRKFVVNTLWASALLSVFLEIFSHVPTLTDDPFLAAVFGSLMYGGGTALTLVEQASTGGTDIMGRLIQKVFPHIQIGMLLLLVNLVIIFATLFCFKQVELVLYGIIALAIYSFTIDQFIRMLNVSKLAFVVSDKGVEIAEKLTSESPRGVTILDAKGAYTMENKNVLICALKEKELESFQDRVVAMDPMAFVIYSESQQILGKGFNIYK